MKKRATQETSDALLNAICETIGDKGYQDWMETLKDEKVAGEK